LTSIAPDTEQLQQLDEGTREAWSAYHERLRELTGVEYERVEGEAWEELQSELGAIQRQRKSLAPEAD
jgi:cell division septum initiation protein DivIVA